MNLNGDKSVKLNRSDSIQMFRALAIIAVVMIHTTPPHEYQYICRPFINFAVATFLFLSGFLTKVDNGNWLAFYKKRIFRVLLPYVFWTFFYTFPYLLKNGINCLIGNLITAQASTPLYYIFVYIQFVLLTPLLGKLARSKYQYLGWLVAPISIIIFRYYGLLMGFELNGYIYLFWSDSCLGWFSFYYLGLILGNQIIKKEFSLKILVLLYVISLFIQIGEGYGWFLLGDANCGSQLKLSSLFSSSIFLLIIYTILQRGNLRMHNKFLISIGDYSFGIYLCHMAVILLLGMIPSYKVIPYPFNSLIVLLFSWGFCVLCYRIVGQRVSAWLGIR